MEGLLVKITFLLSLVVSSSAFAQSNTDCIQHNDLVEIAAEFSQFDRFVGNKAEYCEAEMGEKWLKIGNSLVVLKNIDPNAPAFDRDDAFTFEAITENNWWAYFTNRANKFVLQNNCPEGVVAYVQPFFGFGRINLCDFFFDFNVSSQASVMMHEVRHFDGHRHVTCTQGNEKGNQGACDERITSKGSYAISVQTLVGMARSQDTSKSEKPLLEAEAVYMAFNKFNVVPDVKIRNSIYLSKNNGEVYNWTVGDDAELVATLPEPSVVMNSSSNMTIFPIDANSDAYRMDKAFQEVAANPGLYARHYNSESVTEREKYRSISYFGTGGLLKGNSLLTLCNRETFELGETNLDSMGQFETIISMSLDAQDQAKESLLLAKNGDLYKFTCRSANSSAVDFERSDIKAGPLAAGIVDSFGLNGQQYALMEDGSLAVVSFAGNTMDVNPMSLPVNNSDWISATPISTAEVF